MNNLHGRPAVSVGHDRGLSTTMIAAMNLYLSRQCIDQSLQLTECDLYNDQYKQWNNVVNNNNNNCRLLYSSQLFSIDLYNHVLYNSL